MEVLTPEDPRVQPEFYDHVAVFDFSHMPDGLQGYYWDFPSYVRGKAYMNRGLFDSRARPERAKADLMQALRDSMAVRDRNLSDYELKGHPIRWWDRNGKFAQERILLAGDAAGADPLFGEGISFALGYGDIAAAAIVDAFERNDFSFGSYRDRLVAHPLFKQLEIRTRLARLAYMKRSDWFLRLGWQIAPLVVRFTRWRDPEFVPAESPSFRLLDLAGSS
jgi:flavin-dependent dehydrogenase